jgi:hypothetical protein
MATLSNSKEQLIKSIREWVKLENEIKILQQQLNSRKKEKANLSESIMHFMKEMEVSNVDIQNGQICYSKTTSKKPITQKSLLNILAKYYDGNLDEATQVGQFIFENRETSIKESIKMKMNQPSENK